MPRLIVPDGPDHVAGGRSAAGAGTGGSNGATTGHEAELWRMADTLRGSMDAAEYKHVVLGLIFLKYISDAFEEQHARLEGERAAGADPEDPDEYRAENIFWVPVESRWGRLQAQARQAAIGRLVDDAMAGIERDNAALKEVLPKDYARPGLDQQRLGQLIDLISNITVGDRAARSKDVLGRVYEYFLSQFASAEGKKGGEFYTPRCIVKLLVEMIEPYRGRVYDPCCGSSGMFVQSVEFIDAHATGNGNGGKAARGPATAISIYGQESNYTTWRLAKMNLAIRGIDGRIEHGDSFHDDRHPDLKADFILARDRGHGAQRDRRGELLFIDARKLGRMVDRTHRELTAEDLARVAGAYHAWRGGDGAGEYADVPGFCKSTPLAEVRKNGHVLTPGRYVGAEAPPDDGEPFADKMQRLTAEWRAQQAEGRKLDAAIDQNLRRLGFGG